MTELRKQGPHHIAKLMRATDFHTAMIEAPGNPKLVEVELVRERGPELLVAYSSGLAHEDNQAKQKGFYVDLEEDGSFTVPHEINRPYRRSQIWCAADMVTWLLDEDHLRAHVTGRAVPTTIEVVARLGVILARDRTCRCGMTLWVERFHALLLAWRQVRTFGPIEGSHERGEADLWIRNRKCPAATPTRRGDPHPCKDESHG